jgi:hypothetical protein
MEIKAKLGPLTAAFIRASVGRRRRQRSDLGGHFYLMAQKHIIAGLTSEAVKRKDFERQNIFISSGIKTRHS